MVVAASCTLLIHFILQTKFNYIPESLAVVFLGAIIGLVTKLISSQHLGDWQSELSFHPTTFFLVCSTGPITIANVRRRRLD